MSVRNRTRILAEPPVHPVVLGSGKTLFKDLKNRIRLRLLRTSELNSGAVLLTYRSDMKVVTGR